MAEVPECGLPQVELEELSLAELRGEQHWEGRRLRLRGPVRVEGSLRIDGGTVLFAPDEAGRAGLELVPGSSLEVSGGALLGAADPARGWALLARGGSRLSLVDSQVHHLGTIVLDDRGYSSSEGLVIDTSQAEVRGNTFRWGLGVLDVQAPGVIIRGNRFEHNGSAVLIRAPRVQVEENTVLGGGLFVRVDSGGDQARIAGNRLERTIDVGIKITDGVGGVVVEDNIFENVHQGIEYRRVQQLVLRNNQVQACIQPFLPLLSQAPPGVQAEGNSTPAPDRSACRIVQDANAPDHYPGDQPGLPPP